MSNMCRAITNSNSGLFSNFGDPRCSIHEVLSSTKWLMIEAMSISIWDILVPWQRPKRSRRVVLVVSFKEWKQKLDIPTNKDIPKLDLPKNKNQIFPFQNYPTNFELSNKIVLKTSSPSATCASFLATCPSRWKLPRSVLSGAPATSRDSQVG